MDPLTEVLRHKDLQPEHIDRLCVLFDEVEAQDIRMAFDILMRLLRYQKETQSWSFRLLATHDFTIPGTSFEADLAKRVGHRAEVLLRHMSAWGVPQMKAKVSRLRASSDWAIALTSIVLKISKQYGHVEHSLRVAISRSALITIHCELASMDSQSSSQSETFATSALIDRFQAFVGPLLDDLETATSHAEQARIFRTVKDLDRMFASYREGKEQKMATNDTIDDEVPRIPPRQPKQPPPTEAQAKAAATSTVASPLPSLFSPDILRAFNTAKVENSIRGVNTQIKTPLQNPGPQLTAGSASGPRQFLKQHAPRHETPADVKVLSVDGRMKVLHEGQYVDMQQVLDRNATSTQNITITPLTSMGTGSLLSRPRPGSAALSGSNISQSGFIQALKRGL